MELLLPVGRLVRVTGPLVRYYEGDVWSDSIEVLLTRQNERHEAEFWSRIPGSGRGRIYRMLRQLNEHARGDLFDHERLFIDRDRLPRKPETERTICDEFGIQPRRTMNRLIAKAGATPPEDCDGVLETRLLQRFMWLCLARKIILARAGFPEFCEPWAP